MNQVLPQQCPKRLGKALVVPMPHRLCGHVPKLRTPSRNGARKRDKFVKFAGGNATAHISLCVG